MLNLSQYISIFLGPPISIYLMIYLSSDNSWQNAYLLLITTSFSSYLIFLYLQLCNPSLLIERFNFKSDDQDSKDKGFVSRVGKHLLLLFYVIIPIDHKYNVFPDFSDNLNITSLIIVFLSYMMILIVFMQNSYASPIIRNQKERNHSIITTGLYAYVRHPMYTACILLFIFIPLLLDSLYGILFGLFVSYTFCKRIFVEEEFLLKEFSDYLEYTKKVKYKIFPLIY